MCEIDFVNVICTLGLLGPYVTTFDLPVRIKSPGMGKCGYFPKSQHRMLYTLQKGVVGGCNEWP